MIQNISNFRTANANYNANLKKSNNVNYVRTNTLNADTVSFTGGKGIKFVDDCVMQMLTRLEKEQPVIGFKGDGKWLLPNLSKSAGQKFNLYMQNGEQLSFQRGAFKNNIVFSLKKNSPTGKDISKINLPLQDIHSETQKLLKTKMDKVLSFRITTKDTNPVIGDYKSGQITKLERGEDIAELTQAEADRINDILKNLLPNFF